MRAHDRRASDLLHTPAGVAGGGDGSIDRLRPAVGRWKARRPELEHRLDQRDEVRIRSDVEATELRHGERQREVRQIQRDEVERLRHHVDREVCDVRPLQHDDALVLPERASQLPVSDVDGVDAGDADLQQRRREAAGRRADIERDRSARVDVEPIQREQELRRSPEYRVGANDDRLVVSDQPHGVQGGDAADEDPALTDHRLRIGDVGIHAADASEHGDGTTDAWHGPPPSRRDRGAKEQEDLGMHGRARFGADEPMQVVVACGSWSDGPARTANRQVRPSASSGWIP